MAVKDYKDPRWQKLRLEIMSRDKFKCKCCDATDKELHVHHLEYEKGKRIWEAKPSDLMTLCMDCHEKTEELVHIMRRYAPVLMKFKRRAKPGYVHSVSNLILDNLKAIKTSQVTV